MIFSFLKCRTLKAKGLIALLALVPLHAHAQGAAPAMFGVEDIIIQFPHFGNDKTADACGLDAQTISDAIEQTLQERKVPVMAVATAKPSMVGVARINLLSDVFSFNNQGLDCTSWISLTAESHNSVRIPPVDTIRNVTVTYWREGTMLSSSQSTHAHLVIDTARKLASHFAQQYKVDQPPSVAK